MIYNSRDPRYKSIYGAVEAGQKMTIRLLLPYDSGAVCYSARMLVTEDFFDPLQSRESAFDGIRPQVVVAVADLRIVGVEERVQSPAYPVHKIPRPNIRLQ